MRVATSDDRLEGKIPPRSAVLPSSVWKITNIVISSLAVLFPFAFWATSQLQYATFWQEVLHWKPIHVAAAMLPQGLIGLVIGGLTQPIPGIIGNPRVSLPIGAVCEFSDFWCQISLLTFFRSNHRRGDPPDLF